MSSLAAKMSAITGAVARIPKTGRHPSQGWMFATEGDISDAIRPLMAEQGIAVFSSVVEHTYATAAADARATRHYVRVEYTITDGTDQMVVFWAGEADDWNDKGLNKALTACRKGFLINTFFVSTGLDDDPDGADIGNGSQGQGGFQASGGPQQQSCPQQQSGPIRPREPGSPASQAQRNLIMVKAGQAGLSDEHRAAIVYAETGGTLESITKGDVDKVLTAIQHFVNTGELPAARPGASAAAAGAAFDVVKLAQERYDALVSKGGAAGIAKERVNEIIRAGGVNDMKGLVNDKDPDDASIYDLIANLIDGEATKF